MEDLVDKGLARSIGISNFNVQQLSRLLKASPRIKPANMQVGGPTHESIYIGGSGGVVNSLDFDPASLKSLGRFYLRCVPSSNWKTVTVNLQSLHCQL